MRLVSEMLLLFIFEFTWDDYTSGSLLLLFYGWLFLSDIFFLQCGHIL